jgi:hypothetical protein
MSTSSDLKIGEAIKHRVLVVETATGNAWPAQNPLVTIIDESGNQAVAAAATEESNGWYYYSFTPDAAGTWTSSWALVGATFYHSPLMFKVGSANIAEIRDDTNELELDWKNGGRLDAILDVAQGNTTTIVAATDVATSTRLAAADIAVSAQNAAANVDIADVIGNKTDTTAGTSVVSLIQIVDGNVDTVKTRTEHHLITRTWFSAPQIEVIADTTHTDASLPSVVLPNITGTIVSVFAGFKFRMIENTNAAANKLSGAQEIQVKENAAGAFTDCINLVDDQFGLAASTREGGDCIIGAIDVVAEVAVFNKTYAFQWDEPLTDQTALHFNDVQTFLIVSYY